MYVSLKQAQSKQAVFAMHFNFYIGKDEILPTHWATKMQSVEWTRGLLFSRMSAIFSSGIYHQFRKMERLGVINYMGWKDIKSKDPSPLHLNSNILTLFAIYFICIAICLGCMIIELFIVTVSKIISKGRKSWRKFKVLISLWKTFC